MKAQLITAVAASALLAAAPAFAQKSKDTVRIAFVESINSADMDVDPKPETSFTGRSVFDGLIYYSVDAAGFKPLLAKSWKRVSPTSVEFVLRDDIKWHDGEPFDADDVIFSVNHVLDKNVKYRFKRNTMFIKNAEKLGKYKVRLTAKKANPVDLARYAISLRIRPQHAQSKFANWQDFGRKNPVGTGAYKVASLDKDKGIVLERNDNFGHGKEAGLVAKVKRIHAIPIPDVQTQVAQMLTGGVDLIKAVPKDQAEEMDKDKRFTMSATQSLVYFYLAFDAAGRTKNKLFTDKRVRKALMMAVDRESLVKNVIAGGSEVRTIDAPCFKVQQGCDWSTKPVGYDPAGANRLLAEAGDPNGLEFELSSFSGAHDVSEAVAGQWRKIGVRAKIFRMTFGSYRKRQRDNKQLALVGRYSSGGVPDADALTRFYFGGTARDYYHDDVLNKLTKAGVSTMDVAKRKVIYRQAMDRMNTENLIFPIATNPAVFVHVSEINMKKGSLSNYGIEPTDINWR
jgi:peptide/nickel transport system substrate-binding protein